MALLFMDGFDHYDRHSLITLGNRLKWSSSTLGLKIYATQDEGRYGPGALKIEGTGGGGWIIRTVEGLASDELIVGFSFMSTGSRTTHVYLHHDKGTTETAPRLALNGVQGGTGSIGVFTPGGATCAAPNVLPDDTWVFVEFRVKLGTSDGEIEVKIDGVVVCSETNVNTLGTARVLIGVRIEATANAQLDWIDDLYLLDTTGSDNNTFLHNGVLTPRITVLRPKANGSINTFTNGDPLSAAANWETVDDTLANEDDDFITSSVIGASEAYTMQTFADVSITSGTIHGIQVSNCVHNLGPSTLYLLNEMVIAGTRYDSGNKVSTTIDDYKAYSYIRGTDPSDSAAWTEAKVEAVGSAFSIVNPP